MMMMMMIDSEKNEEIWHILTFHIACLTLVVVLCASPHKVREILLAAEELQMVSSGEYVFFNVDLFTK